VNANQNVKVTNADGTPVQLTEQLNDKGGYIATADQSQSGGTKKISVKTSSGECSVQIRASSELHTEVGFTLDPHSDFPNERPTIVSG
jgi:hypothetical protein